MLRKSSLINLAGQSAILRRATSASREHDRNTHSQAPAQACRSKVPEGSRKHSSLTSTDLSQCTQIISLMFSYGTTSHHFAGLPTLSLFFFHPIRYIFRNSYVHFQPNWQERWVKKVKCIQWTRHFSRGFINVPL